MKIKFNIFCFLFVLSSCAYFTKIQISPQVEDKKFDDYKLVDETGTFQLKRTKGFTADKQFVVKKMLFAIDDLEKDINKPVITALQATIWDLLTISGWDGFVPGRGLLMNDKRNAERVL